jgi:gentisate 1,2-dioxygenase
LSGLQNTISSPIGANSSAHTDAAPTQQLLLEDEGQPATVEQRHAAIRYANPTMGGDVMPTIRCAFHRLRAGAETPTLQETGSTMFQVVDGKGATVIHGVTHRLEIGDIFVTLSWIA